MIVPTGRKAAPSRRGSLWPSPCSGSSLELVPSPTVRPEKYRTPSAGACEGENHSPWRAEVLKAEPGGGCCGVGSWRTKCSCAEDLLESLQGSCQP